MNNDKHCKNDSCLPKPNGDGTWQCFLCRRPFAPVVEAPVTGLGIMMSDFDSNQAIIKLLNTGTLIVKVSDQGISSVSHEKFYKTNEGENECQD